MSSPRLSGRSRRAFPVRLARTGLSIGLLPEDDAEERTRKSVLSILGLIIAAGAPVEMWLALLRGETQSALLMGLWGPVIMIGLVHLAWTGKRRFLQTTLLATILVFSIAAHVLTGGFEQSQGIILWGALTPFGALLLCSRSEATYWYLLYMFVVAGVLVFGSEPSDTGRLAEFSERRVAVALLVLGFTGTVFLLLWYFVGENEKAGAALALKHDELEIERAKSEDLLRNVLPGPIAERLKEKAEVIADRHEQVAVLFADIVGFTSLSSQKSPEQLVELLNEIFTAFDNLAVRHGVEKIKTIGDAYMAVAGLPFPHPKPIEAAVRMGLEMLATTDRLNRAGDTSFDLRIGIHAGPVVAGVIGERKFIYDLWGDTVNLASRLESSGLPGRVQVSEAVRNGLSPGWSFEARGTVFLKGRGETETYFVAAPPQEEANRRGAKGTTL